MSEGYITTKPLTSHDRTPQDLMLIAAMFTAAIYKERGLLVDQELISELFNRFQLGLNHQHRSSAMEEIKHMDDGTIVVFHNGRAYELVREDPPPEAFKRRRVRPANSEHGESWGVTHSVGVSTSSTTMESVSHSRSYSGSAEAVQQARLADTLGEFRMALELCAPLSPDDAVWLMSQVAKLIAAAQQPPSGK